jgi:hypothetical protein
MRRLVIAASLLAAGCIGETTPLSLLDKLRVLEIRADAPEIAMGESTTLRVLAKDFSPLNETISYSWAICRRAAIPGQGRAVHPDCSLNETADFLEPLPDGPTAVVTMPIVKSPLDLGLPDSTGGFYLPIRMTARTATQKLQSFYRLRLAAFGMRNNNPEIARIWREYHPATLNGTPPPPTELPPGQVHEVLNGQNLKLRAEIPLTSLEPYIEVVGDPRDMNFESTKEQVTVRWHTTAGEFTRETTGERTPMEGEVIENEAKTTELKLYEKAAPLPGKIIEIYIVAYDGRGGSSSTMRTILFK